jgi:integrase
VIPLAGVSLDAFRQCPNGFPRYSEHPALSATVNKYLRENGLMETPGHTLYSLRHSFEDRMLAAGVDDRIRRDLFGHRLTRERYGQGASLEHLQAVVQSVAL